MPTNLEGPTCGHKVSLLMQALVMGLSHDPALATFGERSSAAEKAAATGRSERMSEDEPNTFSGAPEQRDMVGTPDEREIRGIEPFAGGRSGLGERIAPGGGKFWKLKGSG